MHLCLVSLAIFWSFQEVLISSLSHFYISSATSHWKVWLVEFDNKSIIFINFYLRLPGNMGRVMGKGPRRHDTWFQVIWIWNHLLKMEAVIGSHLRSDSYSFNCYFQTCITSIMLFGEWSGQKSLKLKVDKICHPGPFCMTRPIIMVIFKLGYCISSSSLIGKLCLSITYISPVWPS